MIVNIVESGCYSDRGIASVHSSVDSAKAHYPNESWKWVSWSDGKYGQWNNTKDWGSLLCISEFELDPEASDGNS